MTAASPPPAPARPGVRPADRLGLTLFLAALLHLAAIFGLGFDLPRPTEASKTLDITLSTFKSEKKPKEADFLAQDNQQGSGTLEHQAKPKTTETAPFQDTAINRVSPPAATPPSAPETAPKAAVATRRPHPEKTPVKHEATKPAPPSPATPTFDSAQLSAEIASLEAELANDVQRYAKRPRILRLSAASTMRDKGAWYKDEWRRKVERIGNLNYPEDARRRQLYGSLRLLVSINRDGTLHEVQILEPSGEPVLDQAALRIVRLAAPYAPFTGDLADIDRLEIIRTWRFERGDRLLSN